MKPLNLDNRPCSPISSNCVIWQGPDIACINICAGDSISDVQYKLATELCSIMDQLNVSNYDLSCLGINSCPPENFHALFQLVLNKVCEANGISVSTVQSSGCPDCVVSIAPCFVDGVQTTMQIVDYVQVVANRVCAIIDELVIINNKIDNLNTRVTVLENATPPTFTLPSIQVDCTLADGIIVGGNTYPIDQILDALVNDDSHGYCALINATGQPADILSAVASECVASTDPSFRYPDDTMGAAYFGSWVTSPFTIADAITNLWLSICDIRGGLALFNNTVVEAGNGVTVSSTTVGTTTTYTVSTLGGLRAQSTPTSLTKVTPTNTVNLYDANAQKQLLTEIYDDDNAYNPLTGIWTCPADGRYDLNFYVHLSKVGVGFSSGMFIAGIITPVSAGYYTVSSMTLNQATRHIDITGSALALNLTAGLQLQLNIINISDQDYTASSGDIARLSIQRVR